MKTLPLFAFQSKIYRKRDLISTAGVSKPILDPVQEYAYIHDEDDMRYINFRYTDQKLQVEEMTGYYPYDHLRYGDFLSKKEQS